MFQRYTEAARRALFFARYETCELGGLAIEPEHILLGLLRTEGLTAHLFALVHLSYADIRQQIQTHLGARERVPESVEIPFSEQTARILRHADEESERLLHADIGTEHLLLGVLREDGSFAASILNAHGMRLGDARGQIAKRPQPADAPPGTEFDAALFKQDVDIVESLERIRFLAEELGRKPAGGVEVRPLLDEIHDRLDALKRRFA